MSDAREIQEFAEKAGAEIVDYSISYAEDMDAIDPYDMIINSSWTVEGELVIDDEMLPGTQTSTVWVSGGGKPGNISRLTNTVNTMGGRQFVTILLVKMVTKLAVAIVEEEVTIPE